MEFVARTLIMGGENQHLQGCKLQVHVFFFLCFNNPFLYMQLLGFRWMHVLCY
jgi:hypothetical protein